MPFIIKDHKIGDGNPTFIIAEAGVNHNGDLMIAKKLIDEAYKAKVDSVKFQTFEPELVASTYAPKAEYQKKLTNPEETQLDMIKKLSLPKEDFLELKDYSEDSNLIFMSSAFDHKSIDFLAKILPAFKVPSGEITNDWFLEQMAKFGKPMLISTGMSSIGEIEYALNLIKKHGTHDLALLHCTSNYPADPKSVNLRAIDTLKQAFGLPTGLSDHTAGIEISLAAVARGANIIEKHFTLDKKMTGPDHTSSMSPVELRQLVSSIRNIEIALGSGIKSIQDSEIDVRNVARRSLVAAIDLKKGTVLSRDNLLPKRPGSGIPIKRFDMVNGRILNRDITKDELIKMEDIE